MDGPHCTCHPDLLNPDWMPACEIHGIEGQMRYRAKLAAEESNKAERSGANHPQSVPPLKETQ